MDDDVPAEQDEPGITNLHTEGGPGFAHNTIDNSPIVTGGTVGALYSADTINVYQGTAPIQDDSKRLGAARKLLEAMPIEGVLNVTTPPPISRLTLTPNPLFVGRDDELLGLARALKAGDARRPVVVATGIGGMGKTQLAIEFAHRYGCYFAGGVFWLSLAEPAGVLAEVAACGGHGLVDRADFGNLKLDDQVRLVLGAWQSPMPRLLIFDNCEDEMLLARWRPPHGGCRILVTSRRGQWDPSLGVTLHPLNVLPPPESIALLRQFRPDLREDDPDLAAIASELGSLPLALHLAGSYLAKYQYVVTPADYLARVSDLALLKHPSLRGSGISPTGHDLDVGRTFALSYNQLDAGDLTDTLAMQLLARAAYFAPGEPIPRALLGATVRAADEGAKLRREDAFKRLTELGLLESETNGALRLHRLLGMFVQALSSDDVTQTAIEQAMQKEAGRLNQSGYPAPLVALQAHLRHITDRACPRGDELAGLLCSRFGYHLKMIGDYRSARLYYEQALVIHREILGERHPYTATSFSNLGNLLRLQGDLEGARSYLEQALTLSRAALGDNHPSTDTGTTLNNLGLVLQEMGDLEGALLLRASTGTRSRGVERAGQLHGCKSQQSRTCASGNGRPGGRAPIWSRRWRALSNHSALTILTPKTFVPIWTSFSPISAAAVRRSAAHRATENSAPGSDHSSQPRAHPYLVNFPDSLLANLQAIPPAPRVVDEPHASRESAGRPPS